MFVVEKDPRFLPSLKLLKEAAGDDRLEVHIGDCLSFNVEEMVPAEARVPWDDDRVSDLVLVGNLPFSVATPFFLKLLRSIEGRSNYYTFGKVLIFRSIAFFPGKDTIFVNLYQYDLSTIL